MAPKVKDMLGISSVIIVTFPVLCRRSRIVKRSKTHCLARGSTFMLTAFTLSEQKWPTDIKCIFLALYQRNRLKIHFYHPLFNLRYVILIVLLSQQMHVGGFTFSLPFLIVQKAVSAPFDTGATFSCLHLIFNTGKVIMSQYRIQNIH